MKKRKNSRKLNDLSAIAGGGDVFVGGNNNGEINSGTINNGGSGRRHKDSGDVTVEGNNTGEINTGIINNLCGTGGCIF